MLNPCNNCTLPVLTGTLGIHVWCFGKNTVHFKPVQRPYFPHAQPVLYPCNPVLVVWVQRRPSIVFCSGTNKQIIWTCSSVTEWNNWWVMLAIHAIQWLRGSQGAAPRNGQFGNIWSCGNTLSYVLAGFWSLRMLRVSIRCTYDSCSPPETRHRPVNFGVPKSRSQCSCPFGRWEPAAQVETLCLKGIWKLTMVSGLLVVSFCGLRSGFGTFWLNFQYQRWNS